MRINKYLSYLGVGSRRFVDCEIELGKIFVNGKKAVLGQDVSDLDLIKVGNKVITDNKPETTIFALNKPVGIISSAKDDLNRKTVVDFIKYNGRLYPVGRLDKNSSGLILLTNNGDLVNKFTHPKYEVEKEYQVTTNRLIENGKIEKLLAGIKYKGIDYKPDKITKIGFNRYQIVLHEGKNREIRKMLTAIGLEVVALKRVRIGKLELGDLEEGEFIQVNKKQI